MGVALEPGTSLEDEGLPLLKQVLVDIPQECVHEPIIDFALHRSLTSLQNMVVFSEKDGGQQVDNRRQHQHLLLRVRLPYLLALLKHGLKKGAKLLSHLEL